MPRRASRLPTAMLVSCRLVRYITPASVPSPLDPGAGLWMEFFVPAARCWGSARAPSQSDEKFGRSSAGRAYGQLSPSFNDGSEIAVHKSSRKSRRRNRPQDRIFKQEGVLTLTPDQVKNSAGQFPEGRANRGNRSRSVLRPAVRHLTGGEATCFLITSRSRKRS
jgi:hypothetical protein